jgi:phycocyanobilin:ferredoxin oxidoreductase
MDVWTQLTNLQDYITFCFETTGEEIYEDGMDQFNKGNWINRVFTSDTYRRAHIDVVDARDTKGIWMMHVCVFPHLDSDAPIYGLDIVAGRNKMTGAFHDFSATTNLDHALIKGFASNVLCYNWKRERELPDWAKKIFSDYMVAAGNVREDEAPKVVELAQDNLDFYLAECGKYRGNACPPQSADAQNRYAKYQKMNPHTPRVMKSLGLPPEDVDAFIQKCLFPEITLDKN